MGVLIRYTANSPFCQYIADVYLVFAASFSANVPIPFLNDGHTCNIEHGDCWYVAINNVSICINIWAHLTNE